MSFLKKALIPALFTSALALSAQASESARLNINQASAEEIDRTLVFVSEQTARQIIEYRKNHGHFNCLNDLSEVSGVSKRLVRYNRSRIRFD